MTSNIPTVADLLQSTAIGNGQHAWPCQGGTIQLPRRDLRQALEDTYDPSMANWAALVELADA
jgi:hypothetical protein